MKTALISLSIAAGAVAAPFSTETIHKDAAPVISSTNAETLPDSYIVVFKKHVDEDAASTHQLWVKDAHVSAESTRAELRKRSQYPVSENIFEGIKHTYNIAGGFLGYSGHFDEDVIEKVRRHPDVSTTLNSHLRSIHSLSHKASGIIFQGSLIASANASKLSGIACTSHRQASRLRPQRGGDAST